MNDFEKFRGIKIREFGKKPRNFLPAKLSSIDLLDAGINRLVENRK